ncbi:MAG: hypothetical protein F6K22_10775 [Okeania sp. SIO2F4]|nr:hypothetical protein [Okeania sp. SIO2F4]NES03286.1 hypothetical protein [Okeania sp. SIO2F4]
MTIKQDLRICNLNYEFEIPLLLLAMIEKSCFVQYQFPKKIQYPAQDFSD